jgi:hypothetical protein
MVVLVVRLPVGRGRALAAGGLLGAALLFKATFGADLLAALAVPLLAAVAEGRRPGRREAARVALMVAGAAALVTAALVPLWLRGGLGGLVDVVLHQDARYAQWAQLSAGPAGRPPQDFGARPGLLLVMIGASRTLAVLGGGAAAALLLARRHRRSAAVVAWWLGCDLAVTMLDTRAFTHYAQQMDGALALAAALIASVAWRRRSLAGAVLAAAAVVATWPVVLAALFVPRAEASLALGHRLPPLTLEGSEGAQLPAYYARAAGLISGRIPLHTYRAAFSGPEYPSDLSRAALLRAHSRPGDPVFVWGWSSSWVYALADRSPASRFIWMNTAYRLYPGAQRLLVGDLARHPPAILLAEQPLPAELRALLSRLGYTAVHDGSRDCWLAPWSPGRPLP